METGTLGGTGEVLHLKGPRVPAITESEGLIHLQGINESVCNSSINGKRSDFLGV